MILRGDDRIGDNGVGEKIVPRLHHIDCVLLGNGPDIARAIHSHTFCALYLHKRAAGLCEILRVLLDEVATMCPPNKTLRIGGNAICAGGVGAGFPEALSGRQEGIVAFHPLAEPGQPNPLPAVAWSRSCKRRGVLGEQDVYDPFSEESPVLAGMTAASVRVMIATKDRSGLPVDRISDS